MPGSQWGKRRPAAARRKWRRLLTFVGILVLAWLGIAHRADAEVYWYYCDSTHAYYPYVSTCQAPWRRVVPSTQTPSPPAPTKTTSQTLYPVPTQPVPNSSKGYAPYSYYCRSLRLDFPYTETCPEPWVTKEDAEKNGYYKPMISCGSGGCIPMDDAGAAFLARQKTNPADALKNTPVNAGAPSKDTDKSEPASIAAGILLIFFALLAYFVPALAARGNHHHNAKAIFILNLFLGWTLLGWVAALVWAWTRPAPSAHNVKIK